MGYGLGVDLGTTYAAAALRHDDGTTRVLPLGVRRAEVPSVVYQGADGTVLVGEAAARRAQYEPGRTAREFKRRLGDPVPLLVGGSPYSAHALMARQIGHAMTAAIAAEGEPPAAVVVTCPANWGPYKRDLLRQAARLADVGSAGLRTEPESAAVQFASGTRVADGEIVAVYDLGGGTFDAAVLRRAADGFVLLGEPEGIEQLGGIDFDEAVFGHVLEVLGVGLDPDDPEVVAALTRLRRDCVEAKEALSYDTEAMIPVALPGLHTRVRLTRGEFETMIEPPLAETIEALRRALRSARVRPEQVHAILLAGGSARIPLVTQVLGTSFDRPTVLDPHPEHSIALGAARLTASMRNGSGRAQAAGPVPRPRSAPTRETAPAVLASAADLGPTPEPAVAGLSAPPPSPTGPITAGAGPPPAAPPEAAASGTTAGRQLGRRPRSLVVAAVLVSIAVVIAGVELTGQDQSSSAACGFRDEFDGGNLNPVWRRTHPDALTVAGGAVTMVAADGAYIYDTYTNAPMLLRPAPRAFVATAGVIADPDHFYQGAGLILWSDDEHYVRVERGRREADGIIFEYNDGDEHSTRLADPANAPAEMDHVLLELTRTGADVRARWRAAGETAWSDLGAVTVDLAGTAQVGVSVLNWAQNGAGPESFDAAFSSFAVDC